MINLVWSGLLTLLLLSGCGFDGTTTRSVTDFLQLTSIEITAVSPTIAQGTSTALKVNGFYKGLSTPKDITDQAVWTISPLTGIAEFIPTASPIRVKGINPGTAILTATVGGVSATYSVTVSSATITAMTITPVNPTIAVGLTTQFAASGTFSDNTTQDLTFDATWSSSPGTFATVSDAPASKGLATARAEGNETITASFGTLPTIATTTLTVVPKALKSIAVSSDTTSVLSLSTANFKAIGTYTDNSTSDITNQVTWASSRSDFATIASGGIVTTLAEGTTSISATLNGVNSAGTNLKVTGGKLNGITLSVASRTPVNGIISLINGTTSRVIAIGSFGNGITRDISGVITWSVADPTKASISTPGGNLAWLTTTAETLAPTTITATTPILIARTNLTIIPPVLQSIAISPSSLNLKVDTTGRLTVTATFNDGTTATQDITASCTWASSNTAIATVDNSLANKGRIKGVAAGGPVTITATAPFTGFAPVTATVAVAQQPLQQLDIFGFLSTTPGVTSRFDTTAIYTDGTNMGVTDDTTWATSNANVAIFPDSTNQPGQVVTVGPGTVTITATFNGKSATKTITVP